MQRDFRSGLSGNYKNIGRKSPDNLPTIKTLNLFINKYCLIFNLQNSIFYTMFFH